MIPVVVVLITLAIIGACAPSPTPTSPTIAVATETREPIDTPTQAPTPTVEPTPEPVISVSRCYEAPDWLGRQIVNGLTAEGLHMERSFKHVYIVDSNDDRPWSFIGGAMYAPGMDGEIGVWATSSLVEPALLVAASTMAAEFSVWDKPAGGKDFAGKFDDEIVAVKQCVKDAK